MEKRNVPTSNYLSMYLQKGNFTLKNIKPYPISWRKMVSIVYPFLILFLFVDCKSEIAEQCKQVCQFSYSCVEKTQTNNLLTQKDREGFEIQCFNTCTMLQDEFLLCHKKNSQSCENYHSCLIDSDIFQ